MTSTATTIPTYPSLDAFDQVPRDYQDEVIDHAFGRLRDAADRQFGITPTRTLYAAPTGVGKGTIELALLKELRGQGVEAWIVTPSLEVVRGFVERCGGAEALTQIKNADRLAWLGEQIFVTTPTRLRNRVLSGQRGMPEVLIVDEVHHFTDDGAAGSGNEVSGTLFALGAGSDADWVGFSATPYRGTPKGCALLKETWGEPFVVLTIPEAVEEGFMALPTFEVIPLVDDDLVAFRNGRFVEKSASKVVASRIGQIAELVRERLFEDDGRKVPTAVTVPSSETARLLVEELERISVDSTWIHQGTQPMDRSAAYARCKTGHTVLISIRVISEGCDFPWLRRLIDARPQASPVSWVQQIGRIMRPGERRPEYLCLCRNLERHAWLMQGGVPRAKIAEAQQAFEKPSKRQDSRSIGLESLRRFKRIDIPLLGGIVGSAYALYSLDSDTGIKTEWLTILDPCSDAAIYATRSVAPPDTAQPGKRKRRSNSCYGKWQLTEAPGDGFVGYATSSQRGALSEKQAAWWTRSAATHGLEPRAASELTRRQFQVLPVLSDCKVRVTGG